MRDMMKEAAKVYRTDVIPRNGHYDLQSTEIIELYNMARQGPHGAWKAITTAFCFGFTMGNHATINRKMKKI